MTSLSDAAVPQTTAAKRNRSEWGTVADVTVPKWKAPGRGVKLGKLSQTKKG